MDPKVDCYRQAYVDTLILRYLARKPSNDRRNISKNFAVGVQLGALGRGQGDVGQELDVDELGHDGQEALVVTQGRGKAFASL